ncbi:MAG: class I SAM-dependent DNA methyltransferase [Candidatus Nanopelagicales bacterium]
MTEDEKKPKRNSRKNSNGGKEPESLEARLWDAANRMRSSVEPGEYKHVVLGLVFLRYISDRFLQQRRAIEAELTDPNSDAYANGDETYIQQTLEDRDEYTAEGVFWVPEGHRWDDLRAAGSQPDIGIRIDAAMEAIEKENDSLKGVLPKTYARQEYTPQMLGGLIDLLSRADLVDEENKSLDILGRVYEYFLGKFATSEGKAGGEYYTPRSIVRTMVEMLEPFNGRVFDPACGSGGMFVQAEEFVRAHQGSRNDISVYGQEKNPTTWRLAKMNLALRGIEADLGPRWGDSFDDAMHPDLRADFIITNPPFGKTVYWPADKCQDDPRFPYGTPPGNKVNYAWLQMYLHHLSPTGTAATVMPNGSLSSNDSGEGEIRRKMVDGDLVDCVVTLPTQLFYGVQIPVCLWFLTKDKTARTVKSERPQRDRRGETLFIDARNLGYMDDRTHRNLSDEDIRRIADTYHAWRGEPGLPEYQDTPGFCASVTNELIAEHGYSLAPGRFVGTAQAEVDDEPTG